ncbi:MAG: NAD+ synthase, partial [Rectinema sp.]|nr:NAD+ synthase [Rectinema sp.]
MRVSIVQMNSTIGDFDGNAQRVVTIVRALREKLPAESIPDLVVFPELNLCGYPPMDLLDQESFIAGSIAALRTVQKLLPSGISVGIGYVDRNRSGTGKSLVNAYSIVHGGRVVFT